MMRYAVQIATETEQTAQYIYVDIYDNRGTPTTGMILLIPVVYYCCTAKTARAVGPDSSSQYSIIIYWLRQMSVDWTRTTVHWSQRSLDLPEGSAGGALPWARFHAINLSFTLLIE